MEIGLHTPQKWGNLSFSADMKLIFLLRGKTGIQKGEVIFLLV